MFDSFISKVGMKALALVTVMLLVSAVTFLTVTRVRGFGMMDENETAASQNNSPETTFTQNQLNCLNLDDGWWSPISGPIMVKACGPSANTGEGSNLQALSKQTETSTTPPSTTESSAESTPTTESQTTSTPPTETETSTPSTDVTETKDKEGNTVLSSTFQNLTITATQSIKEIIGTPEVAQQVAKQVINESKNYNRGLVQGVKFAFSLGDKGEELIKLKTYIPIALDILTKDKSVEYKLGFSRGLTLGADFVEVTGVSGLAHKQKVK